MPTTVGAIVVVAVLATVRAVVPVNVEHLVRQIATPTA